MAVHRRVNAVVRRCVANSLFLCLVAWYALLISRGFKIAVVVVIVTIAEILHQLADRSIRAGRQHPYIVKNLCGFLQHCSPFI